MRTSIKRRIVLVAIAAAAAGPVAVSAVPASAASSCSGNSTCASYDLTPTSGGSGSLGVTLGGSISASTIIGRAEDWVSQAVPYTGSSGNWDNAPWSFWTDSQVGGPYRQDCSGLVSMAWGLNVNTNTDGLPSYSHELTANGNPDPSQLQPGDALIAGGHTVIFDGWYNSAHTQYYGIEETPPDAIGDPANPDIIPYPYWSTDGTPDGAVAGEFGDTYWPYRYNNEVPAASTAMGGVLADLTGNGMADLLAINPSGDMLYYPNTGGTGTSMFGSPTTVGTGWTGYTLAAVGKLYGSSLPGILAINPSGDMLYYPNTGGTGTSMFGSPTTLGTGWTGYTVAGLTDLYGSSSPGILAVNPSGDMLYYPNTGGTGTSTFGSPELIGTGWTGYTVDAADINGDGQPDLLAINPSGNMYLYPNTGGTGTSTFGSAELIGSGWSGYEAMDVGFLTGAKGADVLAIDPSGNMYLYPNISGTGTATFGSPTLVGNEWTGYTVAGLTDLYGSSSPGILAINPSGDMLYYPNTGGTGTSTFGSPTTLGTGWTGYSVLAADFTGDGEPDVLAINPSGDMYLYPNTGGTGTSTFGSPTLVGEDWTGYTLAAVGNLYGSSLPGILAINPSGDMLYYPNTGGTGTSMFGSPTTLGTGWTGYTVAGLTDLYGSSSPGILAVNPSGDMLYYPNTGGTGTSTFGSPELIGTGWTGWTVNINGDGQPDLLAINPSGDMYLYPNGTGVGFGSRTLIGTGWSGYTIN